MVFKCYMYKTVFVQQKMRYRNIDVFDIVHHGDET